MNDDHAQGFAELVLERDQEETGGGGGKDGNGDDLYALPEILSAVRRACLSRAAVPVLCGSSLRGIGVEPLLDSVSTFLPSPLDRPRPTGVVREVSASLRGGGGGGGGGGGKKRRRGEGAVAGGGGEAAAEGVVDVDPLQDDLVAFVFKVCNYERSRSQQPWYLCVGPVRFAVVRGSGFWARGVSGRPKGCTTKAAVFRCQAYVSSGDLLLFFPA